MRGLDPVVLFERATARAATVMAGVSADQLSGPTPCTDWDVQHLIDHMVGGADPELIEACIAMFLPDMPERGRASDLVGPAIEVSADASAQDRLLGAMGRQP